MDSKHHTMGMVVGTSYYMAPEVLQQRYTVACDVWSIGVVAYVILRKPPFTAKTTRRSSAVKRARYAFDQPVEEGIAIGKDFIRNVLSRNPRPA